MTHRFKEHIIMCFTFLPATAIDPNFPRLSHFFFFFLNWSLQSYCGNPMIGFFSLYENSSELKRCWWVFARKKLLCWMSVLTLALTKPQSVLLALVFLLEYGKYTTSLCSLHLYKFVSTFRQPVTWATNRSSILCPIWWKYECLNMPHRSRLCWRRCLCYHFSVLKTQIGLPVNLTTAVMRSL